MVKQPKLSNFQQFKKMFHSSILVEPITVAIAMISKCCLQLLDNGIFYWHSRIV